MEDIKILETFRYRQKTKNYNKITLEDVQAIENLIARNKELEADLYASDCIVKEQIDIISNSVSKDEIKAKIEELDERLDYINKELTKAYIEREKLGIESEIDVYEQYIYNMEQEQSIRHTQKYAYKELLNKGE